VGSGYDKNENFLRNIFIMCNNSLILLELKVVHCSFHLARTMLIDSSQFTMQLEAARH
jgi:hypothetical protein